MSAAEDPSTLSKSARKRANQKARAAEAGAAEEAPAPAPVAPAAKSKAAAKAKAAAKPEPAAAEPKAKAKAKGKAKAEPAPAAAAPKADAKAKAKGKAEPKPAAQPAAAEPKAKAKAATKAAAKSKPAKAKAEEEPEEKTSNAPLVYYEIDDGTNAGDWEVSSGVSKKAQRRKEAQIEVKELEKAHKSGAVITAKGNQHIPGLAPAAVQQAQVKGGAKAAKGPAVSQAVGAIAVVSAAAADNKGKAPEKAAVVDNNVSVTVKVPEAKIGRVVGPKGANVNLIKEKTGVKTIDMSGDMCTIVGLQDAVTMAEHAVKQLVEKGYMSLAFEDFEEEGVLLHPSLFPDIIGQKGAIIQEIKKQAKVEVNIPVTPKNGPAGKKYKVTLAGSKAGVMLGKEILSHIEMYGHHDLIHPGQTHKEMEIESWQYAFIIGSKGSEMRHIQNNYKVRVNIPREFSANRNVVIVGEARDVERAEKYIEKVLYESEQPRGRGSADKATDDWGDEGEVEDWMRPYMYKR